MPAEKNYSSRRLRLWELPFIAHNAVIGICLHMDALRAIVEKYYGAPCVVEDYKIHATVIAACSRREPLVDLIQRELERRYASDIKRFQTAKTTEAVTVLWDLAVASSDVEGALWAALTHPRSDECLRQSLCLRMQMLQLQMASEARRKNKKVATDLLEATQDQHSLKLSGYRLAEIQASIVKRNQILQQDLRAKTCALATANATIESLEREIKNVKSSIPEFSNQVKLLDRIAVLEEKNNEHKLRLRSIETTGPREHFVSNELPRPATSETDKAVPLDLMQMNVLCVGGRSGGVASYREVVESAGGTFAHHDGGIEHNAHRLDTSLSAADCVVCQTGSISHTAYWRVKEYCKKNNKRCIYVDRPSVSSFVEGLNTIGKTLSGLSKEKALI